ncbi:MAG TPA: hypothetical protein VM240_01170 [Verrucomicrobiae bacterium]|nr:hypothetical protein [Verrucomicrobiae bacterium]
MLLAIGVTIPIGLAPLLGTWDVPGFRALLSLFPEGLQESSIRFSTFGMAVVAASVQFLSQDTFTRKTLRQTFIGVVVALFALLFLLAKSHNEHVVRIPVGDGSVSVSYVVGSERKVGCSCAASEGDAQCVKRIGLDAALLPSCWNEKELRGIAFALQAKYVLLMIGLGALVGLIVLAPARSRR